MERIVLGYSGSLDTSVAIPWLAERYGADVVAVTLDLGQGWELADIRERALSAGAVRAHVLDVRDEFARQYVLPVLQAGATGRDGAPALTALGRPLIAQKLIEIARIEGATAVAHGCLPCSDDEGRLESALRAVDASVKVLAPLRESHMTQDELIAYARTHHIFAADTAADERTTDVNLWGRSVDITAERTAGDEIYVLTRAPEQSPDEAAYLDVEFEGGVPVRANGIEMPLSELIESIETIAGVHGVGRFDGQGNADVMHVYEAPAARVLQTAHAELERTILPRRLRSLKDRLGREYTRLIDEGRWFSPTREAIDAFVASVQRRVSGTVRVELLKGRCRATSCRVDSAVLDRRPALEASTPASKRR
jgi:argininosuccinate synthase